MMVLEMSTNAFWELSMILFEIFSVLKDFHMENVKNKGRVLADKEFDKPYKKE